MIAADPKTQVEGAYAAWDAAFKRGDRDRDEVRTITRLNSR